MVLQYTKARIIYSTASTLTITDTKNGFDLHLLAHREDEYKALDLTTTDIQLTVVGIEISCNEARKIQTLLEEENI